MKWCTHHDKCLPYKPVRAVLWSGFAAVCQVKVQQLYVPKEWGQLTTWIYWMTRLFHQWIFSCLMARAYSKTTMPGFIRLKLGKSGSGSMRHHFHTWIGHHSVQSQTLTPLRIFGMYWRRLCKWSVSPIINTKSWRKLYAILDRNKCCDIAEAYRNDATANVS